MSTERDRALVRAGNHYGPPLTDERCDEAIAAVDREHPPTPLAVDTLDAEQWAELERILANPTPAPKWVRDAVRKRSPAAVERARLVEAVCAAAMAYDAAMAAWDDAEATKNDASLHAASVRREECSNALSAACDALAAHYAEEAR